MAREKGTATEEALKHLARRKSGASILSRRKVKKITDLSELNQHELAWATDYAAVLKAVGYSWRYISDTLGIQTSLVKGFADSEGWDDKVAKVAADKVEGAVNHMQAAAVELTEGLLEIARSEPDTKIRLSAIIEGLDRVGITKVNKSESVVTKNERTEVDVAEGFFDKFEALPIETQKQVAALMGEVETLVSEAKGTE